MILEEAFEVHNELNPKIWTDNTLRPEVHDKIIEIVDAFKKYIQVPIYISDIHIVGSNASYNYTDQSDLDVHIVANFSFIDSNKEILSALYNNLRTSFKAKYDISIHGIPVELYVEDINSNVVTNGIYSVIYDRWIKFPNKIADVKNYDIQDECKFWHDRADKAIKSENKDDIAKVIDNIYLLRKNSLAVGGEFSKGNQIFKQLRNDGIIDDLRDTYTSLISSELTLERLEEEVLDEVPEQEEKAEITEASVNNLLSKSKSTEAGQDRFKKRLKSKISTTPKQYNQINMNKLFKDGILTVDIEVKGEHGAYIVKVSYGGFLDILHDQLKKVNNVLDLKVVTKTLITGFNRGDVYIHCDCDDFKYRYNYWNTKNGINSGNPENRPSNITNPNDDMGCGCKHALLVLTNTAWILKCATCVYNYILYMEKHQEKLYKKIIYPAIYNKEFEEPKKEEPEPDISINNNENSENTENNNEQETNNI